MAMNRENSPKKANKADWDMKKYVVIASVTFITFCCCILFFFLIYRYHGFTQFFQKLMGVLQPIIIGFVVAYLINPVMIFLEKALNKFLMPRMKNEKKVKKLSRSIGVTGALLFLLLIIFLLLEMIIPQLIKSIQNMLVSLPSEINSFTIWVKTFLADQNELATTVENTLVSAANFLENFLQTQLLPQATTYIASITTGVISIAKLLFNFIIGLIVSVYILMTKETFVGQGKKVVYALFNPKTGNIIIRTVRKSNQIFGGFISGKILDSVIIGLLCYIVLVIMHMPYSLLVSVIVGVTNVIPFFGPYIGAIPSAILIILADPIMGIYFLIFILILQQIDGNIIGPKILGDSTGLNSFWVVFAILIGGGLFGILGMILGVPVFAVIYYIARQIIAYVLRKKNLPEHTADYITMDEMNEQTGVLKYADIHQGEQETEETPEE